MNPIKLSFHLRFAWVLIEAHKKDCTCSYCKGHVRLHYGLNIPKCKAWNSWWTIKYGPGRYLRWTNSWLKWFKKKD